LYKFVYADDVRKFDGREEPEDWDRQSGARGFRTRNGEIVKSKEERTIADWLYFNGVRYEYEGSYKHETADATHRQYRPDFYYPDAKLYHEHFALDESGMPPDHFEGYLDSVRWKRELHSTNETPLYETTSAGLRAGTALDGLAQELTSRGIGLDPREDRPLAGRPIPPDRELARSLRVFQVHAKSNRLSVTELRQRLADRPGLGLHGRHQLFLQLYERISAEWERRLAANNLVDFEDMLNQAADHIKAGRWRSPYRLVLADEFQDASLARARLLQALVLEPGRFLCAVGDDWQSINRFAGADIKVMSHFEEIFGEAETRFLSTSFRCPQALCDLSGTFVSRNPAQLAKTVKAINEQNPVAVVCHAVAEETGIEPLVEAHLRQLSERVKSGEVETGPEGYVAVFVLGRYWHNKPSDLEEWREEFAPNLRVTFSTIHGAKGLEADYVCIVGLTQGRYGFPSQMEDDPIYQLAMPEAESFPYAEERRLLYVALTRARRLAMLYTVEAQVSEFLIELQGDPYRIPIRRGDSASTSKVCLACGRGLLVRKQGRHGAFLGCSRFPACDHTEDCNPRGRTQGRRSRRGRSQ
jgi:DNA helicase-4